MLPGNAKLRVCFLPFVGENTAEGLDVSTVSVDCLLASPEFSLRFCEWSVNCKRLILTLMLTLTWFSGAILYKVMFAIDSPMAAILVKLQCWRRRESATARSLRVVDPSRQDLEVAHC